MPSWEHAGIILVSIIGCLSIAFAVAWVMAREIDDE